MRDRTVKLPDGRTLGYTDLGAPEGPLVFYFHGAPSSRLDLVAFDEAFVGRGVRVVCPERPSYGVSSPRPGRQREDWPADVAAVADSLGRERFAVIGISSGGPYTVACAALLPSRVVAATVVAGVTDVAWSGYFDDYGEMWGVRELMAVGDEEAARAWCDKRFGADGRGLPREVTVLSAADSAFVSSETNGRAFRRALAEALRQGTAGYAQDIVIEGRPWAFDASRIAMPVRVIHGADDTLLTVGHSKHTAELIPGASFEVVPGHGHLSIFEVFPDYTADLATHVS